MKKFSKLSPKRVRKCLRSMSKQVSYLQKFSNNMHDNYRVLLKHYHVILSDYMRLRNYTYVLCGVIVFELFTILALWLAK